MIFDYIEIGTSDFRTNIITKPDSFGIAVDPVRIYLDRLPSPDSWVKVCAAVSSSPGKLKVFYCDPEYIEKHELPLWLKGCNSIQQPHPTVVNFCKEHAIQQDDLVREETCEVITVKQLFDSNKVTGVKVFKVDTEGHDHVIMNCYLSLCIDNEDLLAPLIIFENNELSNKRENHKSVLLLEKLGYKCEQVKSDMICRR